MYTYNKCVCVYTYNKCVYTYKTARLLIHTTPSLKLFSTPFTPAPTTAAITTLHAPPPHEPPPITHALTSARARLTHALATVGGEEACQCLWLGYREGRGGKGRVGVVCVSETKHDLKTHTASLKPANTRIIQYTPHTATCAPHTQQPHAPSRAPPEHS